MCRKPVLILIIVFVYTTVVLAEESVSTETFTLLNLGDIQLIEQLQTRQDYMTDTYLVTGMAISPNSRRLLIQWAETAASSDNLIQLWDLESFTLIKEFHYESQPLTLQFSPDERYFVSADLSFIHLISAMDGEPRKTWENGYFAPESIKFSPNGHLLSFFDSTREEIVLWDISNTDEYAQYAYPNVTNVVFNPTSPDFVFGNSDNQIYRCVIDAEEPCAFLWEGDETFGNVMFNRQGDLLAVDTLEDVRILEVATARERSLIPNIWVNRFLMRRDFGNVVATAFNNQIGFVNIDSQEMLTWINEDEYLNDIDNTENFYAMTPFSDSGNNAIVSIYKIAGGNKLAEIVLAGEFTGMNLIAQFSPDNRYFIAARSDGLIQLWGVEGS